MARKPNKTRITSSRTSKRAKFIDITKEIIPSIPEIQCKNRLGAKSENQKEFIRTVVENDIVFCEGVAGSGKTHIAIGMALEWLLMDKVSKIVITRPVVEAGERLGFLPGTAEEKLHPYLMPILDEINYFIDMASYAQLKNYNQIEVVPFALMRGRSFHNAFIVADECQNASYEQLKMLLTRIGMNSKMVLTGDTAQSDLQHHYRGGFRDLNDKLSGIEGIGFSKLNEIDIVRNPIIAAIVKRLSSYENSKP